MKLNIKKITIWLSYYTKLGNRTELFQYMEFNLFHIVTIFLTLKLNLLGLSRWLKIIPIRPEFYSSSSHS